MRVCLLATGWIVTISLAAAPARSAESSEEGSQFFEARIRPVLAQTCGQCHGAAKQKGMLRLDNRAAVLKGGDSGPAVVPGEPDKSLLLKAIRYSDPDLRMPPRGKLAEQQVADFATWVRMGAPWPDDAVNSKAASDKTFNLKERSKHWSLLSLRPIAPPAVKDGTWPRNSIDRFILARLEAAGLRPAPSADRRTLLRRVTFDLTGLPPTPAEIEAFLTDRAPDAFARVVDRLLASPQYGERWGRHWLDLVRYAETAGHEFDYDLPNAFRYCDYIIRAFNADLPYDQLMMEHVAGDLLPSPRRHVADGFNESILGTGFWHLGEARHSPVDVRADQADRLDNQIDVFAKTFLGLTVACARCHDHKFDAISTRDYYALCGYLESSRYQQAFIDDPEPVRAKVRSLKKFQAEILALAGSGPRPEVSTVDVAQSDPAGGVVFADFRMDGYAKWFVSGEAFGSGPSEAGAVVIQPNSQRPIRSMVPAGVAHSGVVSGRLQGVLRSGTFTIDKRHIHYRALGRKSRIRVIIDGYQLIREPIYGGLQIAINNEDHLQWHTQDVGMWLGHRAYIELVDDGPGYLGVQQIVFSDGPSPMAAGGDVLPGPEISEIAAERLRTLLHKYREIEATLTTPRRALALEDGTPVDESVFVRGNHKKLGEHVPRRFLEVFAGAEQTVAAHGSGRLELAWRLVDPTRTPIVPRVLVNRLWQHHFGEGLVRSPDDFGVLGQAPTHPDLLDALAVELVRQGWSLKKMHRLMLLSNTYQMSSRGEEDAERTDPQNRLLHHMPVRRLEGEAIRDALLAISGRLERTMFGPSVPPYLTPFMTGRGRPEASGPLDGAGRRSIYLNVRRNFLTPMFLAFDYPIPFSTRGRRSVSNVPAQALTLMNNPFVHQQAELWAKRILADPVLSPRERVERMYLSAFARPPTDVEMADVLGFLEERRISQDAESRLRAWRDLCHVLVNVKEFIYIN
jgi:mono/diheme cytochrome c family protein